MKRMSYMVALLSVSALASACADRFPTEIARTAPSPAADLATDRYPTQAEYNSVCSGPTLTIDDPTAAFSADYAEWDVGGHARYNCVNEADAELDASIVRNSDGGLVNSATPWTLNWSQYRPTWTELSISPVVTVSTLNNNCGITGRGSWAVHATMTFLDVPLWTGGETKPAPQVSLSGCETVATCGTEIISDGNCDNGGGGPSGDGGGSNMCDEHEIVIETSYDGGNTWYVSQVLGYYWVCY